MRGVAARARGVRALRSIYHEIYNDLRERIEAGEFSYQEFIPSEAKLVEHYACSHNTVRKALSVLRMHGYVQPIWGKGVLVILPVLML